MKRRISAEFTGTGRFDILRCIGAGGMGTVYEAFDKERNAHVALKTLRAMNAESLLRFKKEFRDFQDLSHPNLVSVGELFADEGEWFFTMELIDGVNFLEYVRPGTFSERSASFDDVGPTARTLPEMISSPRGMGRVSSGALLNEARLRTGLRQLALGLHALHEAAKVHRDIKPTNILVTQHGRVVLLDFGLATDLEGREHKSEVDIVGTVEYMAPEQAAARQVGPAADWYAVGVILYEALTGQVPLSGPPIEVLMNKQRLDAPSPRAINPAAPEDLSRLAAELLRFNPATRPSGKQVLERLGAATGSGPSAQSLSSFSTSSSFVGRAAELKVLAERFERARKAAQTVCVHGESGLGKSALVRHFVETLKSRESGVVVLAGTCYERESVPFKAVDGLIDALSQYMRRLPKAESAALLPRRASLLAQVFPVLQRVEAVAEAPRAAEEVLDPQELRSRLFAALRELLERLADRHPLVLVIDDLQWADADSLALLGELMRPPEAPCLLLIATVRSDDGASGPTRRQSLTEQLRGEIINLQLERMSAEESRELAETLIKRAPDQITLNALAIAQEAGGHPLFIDELIRHAVAVGAATPGPLQLEDALWARIMQLEPDARRVLELLALSGGRLIQHTAAQAAGMAFGDFGKHIALLRVAHLLRTTGMRAGDSVEPYHDRVRASVLSHLDSATVRRHHQRLAVALETSGQADFEALTIHWREAGDLHKAAHFAERAAEGAMRALAFDRAAQMYDLTIALSPVGQRGRELWQKLGEACANAGYGKRAATAFVRAASLASAAESLDLKRRAAEQFLITGHLDDGFEVLKAVLPAAGIRLRSGQKSAIASLLMNRARVRLSGLRFKERDASEVAEQDLMRIDICWSVALAMSLIDTLQGADFQARGLILALEAGEPYRVARALAMEAGFVATAGGRAAKRTALVTHKAGELARRIGHPHALGLAALSLGITAFLSGRWRESVERSRVAEAAFRERCTGVTYELDNAQLYPLWSLIFLGDLCEAKRRAHLLLKEAKDRGDLYLETSLRTRVTHMIALADDRPREGRADVEAAIQSWPNTGSHLQHYFGMVSQVELDLYEDDYAGAKRDLQLWWDRLSGSTFFRVQMMRIESRNLRARVMLAGPVSVDDLRAIERDAKVISREKMQWGNPLSALLKAAVATQRRQQPLAVKLLDEAVNGFHEAEMFLHEAAAMRRKGELMTEAALIASADEAMSSRSIKRPDRMTAMLAPGFALR